MIFVKRSLPVLMVVLAALSAHADTLNVVANGSVASYAGGVANGFYMATYADSSTLQAFGSGQVGTGNSVLYFPEFALPTGAVVTGASLNVSFDPLVQGTTAGTISEPLPPPGQGMPSTPGAINVTVSTATSLGSLLGHSLTTDAGCQLDNPGNATDLLAAGFGACLSGTEDYLLDLNSMTTLTADLVSSGFNSAEIFNFTGGNSADVTANLSIEYTVTPEPSGMVLLGTGLLALMAAAWYRRSDLC